MAPPSVPSHMQWLLSSPLEDGLSVKAGQTWSFFSSSLVPPVAVCVVCCPVAGEGTRVTSIADSGVGGAELERTRSKPLTVSEFVKWV